MKQAPKIILTSEDKSLLYDMLNRYKDSLYEDDKAKDVYMQYAENLGSIAQVGDKYTHNIKFFEIRGNIRKAIEERKKQAQELYNRLTS